MAGSFRILRPLGQSAVGDRLAIETDGRLIEGLITFLIRTPTGGWMVTLDANGATYEVYCAKGECTLVSQIASDACWTFEQLEYSRQVVDSQTGRRFTATGL